MEEILHQLTGSLSHYLQGFIHPRWCRISSINSIYTKIGIFLVPLESISNTPEAWIIHKRKIRGVPNSPGTLVPWYQTDQILDFHMHHLSMVDVTYPKKLPYSIQA